MSVDGRVARTRPRASGWELTSWYLVRLSGLALFVLALAHFAITQFLVEPAAQTATWIIEERWASMLWRTVDWLMLMLVLVHGVLGVRTVVTDYVTGSPRTLLLMGLFLLGFVLAGLGTTVVMTLPYPIR